MGGRKKAIGISASVLAALAIILAGYYLLLKPDSCSSELYLNGRSLSLETAVGELNVKAKANPTIQQVISERLQAWAQTSSHFCRMHREGAISDAEYHAEIRRISDSYNRIDSALDSGQLRTSDISPADLDALVFNRIVRPARDQFIIFFHWDSYEVSPEAGAILDNLAQRCRQMSEANQRFVISIQGHSDNSEAGLEAPELTPVDRYIGRKTIAARRIASTIRYLRAALRGACDAPIAFIDYGAERPLVPTGPGVREPQNRRSEIILYPAL